MAKKTLNNILNMKLLGAGGANLEDEDYYLFCVHCKKITNCDAELMKTVREYISTNGRFSTHSAKGFVRGNLESAGFDVELVAGHGRKRHLSVGVKR